MHLGQGLWWNVVLFKLPWGNQEKKAAESSQKCSQVGLAVAELQPPDTLRGWLQALFYWSTAREKTPDEERNKKIKDTEQRMAQEKETT